MGDATRSRYARYVVTDLPKFEKAPGHHSPPPSWIYPDIFPGISMRINGTDVSRIVRDPHADPHVHEDHPEIYLAVTGTRGDIVIEVQMEEEKFTVESPFAVFIPPGVRHCFTVLKCDSPNYVFGIHVLDYKRWPEGKKI
jgi:mannose-6-phosphate isomerase-like protein (cupin superfamily)